MNATKVRDYFFGDYFEAPRDAAVVRCLERSGASCAPSAEDEAKEDAEPLPAGLHIPALHAAAALVNICAESLAVARPRLLAAGAQKELRNGDGQTALQLAQAGGHAECVRLLADPSERRAAVRAAVRRRSVSQPQHVGFAAAANPLARWRRCLPCLK